MQGWRMTDFGLSNKAVIITGGAGGLGRAFAKAFVGAGARVAIADIDERSAVAAAGAIGVGEGRCRGLGVDVTDEASVARMAERASEAFGGIDVLVNNAALYGTLERKPFFEIGAEEWDRVLAVTLKGAFLCAKAAYPHMRARGGRIVNIASASAMSGSPLWLHYVSSKGGMIAMTRGMARELGEHGITVNAVAPGFTLTEASRKISDNAETWGVDRGAIRRAEQPEDVVGAVLWLASPHSDFVTGQTLIVDGGRQFA
jgi:NAD(P)-dependent dehydrogenase (short-subunit alcohol dehydrogenase family)